MCQNERKQILCGASKVCGSYVVTSLQVIKHVFQSNGRNCTGSWKCPLEWTLTKFHKYQT